MQKSAINAGIQRQRADWGSSALLALCAIESVLLTFFAIYLFYLPLAVVYMPLYLPATLVLAILLTLPVCLVAGQSAGKQHWHWLVMLVIPVTIALVAGLFEIRYTVLVGVPAVFGAACIVRLTS